MEMYEAAKIDPPMPAIGPGQYLLRAVQHLGWCEAGNALRPISWSEIKAYSDAVGPFSADEMAIIRSISAAYVEGLGIGKNPLGIPPFGELE